VEQSKTIRTCPICGSTELKSALHLQDHFLSKENFELIECAQCTVRITQPQPPESEIFKYYKSDEYVSHSDTKKGLINLAYQQVKAITLRSKLRLLRKFSPATSVLDFGCGTGDFLLHCQKNGLETMGVEPDADARKRAIEKGLNVVSIEESKQLNTTFDSITLWHVLEHTYDPSATIQQLIKNLAPDGVLVIAVPNYLSHDAQLYGEYWAAYDVPRHLFHFTPKTIEVLSRNCGLKLVLQQGMPFDAFYVSMLSEKYRQHNMIKGVFRGLSSNYRALYSLNSSSMIYVLKKQAI